MLFQTSRKPASSSDVELAVRDTPIPAHTWHQASSPTLYVRQFSADQPQLTPEALIRLGRGRKTVIFRTRVADGDFFFDKDAVELCDYGTFIRTVSQQSQSTERVYSRIGAPAALVPPELQALRQGSQVDHTTIWVGGDGNVTPLHCDAWPTLLAQLAGAKEVILMPPHEILALSPSLLACILRRRVVRIAKQSGWWIPGPEHRFVQVTLRPGDTLYIPPGFLHAVRSLSFSCSASIRATAVPLDQNPALRHVRIQGSARDLGLLPSSSSGAGSRMTRRSADELRWLLDG
jgi:hypothetical protein